MGQAAVGVRCPGFRETALWQRIPDAADAIASGMTALSRKCDANGRSAHWAGADDGNRTRVFSLGSCFRDC
jgi:hypothetical protein